MIACCHFTVAQQTTTAASTYKPRKLTLEEVDFASSYYQQEGSNSAVTGGIGDEHLTDMATTLDVHFGAWTRNQNKHHLDAQLGVDMYTSASSDKINPNTISSASKSDVRVYPSATYSYENTAHAYRLGAGLSYSKEYDYTSYGANAFFSAKSKDRNAEFGAKGSVFLDTWKVIYPFELRPAGYGSGGEHDKLPVDSKPRNSYGLSLSFTQILSKTTQFALLADVSYQEGLLGTKFHRIYFDNGQAGVENLPGTRFKIPIGTRFNWFAADHLVLRSYYRYYWDNWEVQSHTASLEMAIKWTPFISITPTYRYYTQTAARYFAPYQQHQQTEAYYTSDYDLSKFQSNMYGLNLRWSNLHARTKLTSFDVIEFRYGFYDRSNGLKSHIVTMVLTFK
ncbi:MAG: hypothetical protein CFE24_02900 [Flavobacterium sp. BFFFF2]|nr:MAG: hypothetical protein CFE24_02900 [Flavobacterium sp. BFFFF2]